MRTPINRERWELVSQLYRGALEREESHRADYLATACAGDEELRLEVESLLAQEGKAESFLEKPAVEVAARIAESNAENQGRREILRPPQQAQNDKQEAGVGEFPSSPTAALGLGATISHYRIVSKLGTVGYMRQEEAGGR